MFLFLLFVSLLALVVYYKLYVPNQYWKKKGIPYVTPYVIFGNLGSMVFRKKTFNEVINESYKQFKSHRYFGFYQFSTPTLVVSDIELIKQICVRNFDSFSDRPDFIPKDVDPFWKKAIANREGKDWHDMRAILSPAFSSRKMKAMFELMYACSEKLVSHFTGEGGTVEVEMKDLFTRFTSDATASCLYGIQCDSMQDKQNEFFLMGQKAFDFRGFKSLKFFASKLNHALIKMIGLRFFDDKIKNFFMRITKESIDYREKTGLLRPDMIHFLREAQKGRLKYDDDDEDEKYSGFAAMDESDVIKSDRSKKITIADEDIAIQVLIFFFGGYDTVSVALCQLAYELALNVDIQEKLQNEIDSVLKTSNGKITYDEIMKMKYLDMVISEILRLWSPAVVLFRMCVKPFEIEPVLPHEKPFIVEPGTEILIPTCAIQRDSKHYINPEQFDPERFNEHNKSTINPYTFQSFGIGPRHCIGNRFALMAIKTIIFSLLSQFQIVPVKKTVIPFVQANSVGISSAYDYWFGLKRRI